MTDQEKIDLIRQLAESVAWNCAVYQRGGSAKVAGKAQERAFQQIFSAFLGRKPTVEELEDLGGPCVFGM